MKSVAAALIVVAGGALVTGLATRREAASAGSGPAGGSAKEGCATARAGGGAPVITAGGCAGLRARTRGTAWACRGRRTHDARRLCHAHVDRVDGQTPLRPPRPGGGRVLCQIRFPALALARRPRPQG